MAEESTGGETTRACYKLRVSSVRRHGSLVMPPYMGPFEENRVGVHEIVRRLSILPAMAASASISAIASSSAQKASHYRRGGALHPGRVAFAAPAKEECPPDAGVRSHKRPLLTRSGCDASGQDNRSTITHHRKSGKSTLGLLLSLCPGCRARLHRKKAVLFAMPPLLLELWREQHPRATKTCSPLHTKKPAAKLRSSVRRRMKWG